MAVRSDCFGGEDWDVTTRAYSQDFNDTFAAVYDCVKTEDANVNVGVLENAINISKLQYCQSVADIDHDYLVVDTFTDSTGYNNTIDYSATSSTNMYYKSTGLTGHYTNQCTTAQIPSACSYACYTGIGDQSLTTTCYGGAVYICLGSAICWNMACGCFCPTSFPTWDTNVKEFCYNGFCCITTSICGTGTANICLNVSGHLDNTAISTSASAGESYATTINNCYCYLCNGSEAFDFYKNGSCITSVSGVTTFPNVLIGVCACYQSGAGGSGTACSSACFSDFCVQYASGCVVTVPICYTTSSVSVYMVAQQDTTTLVYDVYDANNTSTAISTSLALNTLNYLSTCVDCHIYHFRPQNIDHGCFKTSYAIAVSEV